MAEDLKWLALALAVAVLMAGVATSARAACSPACDLDGDGATGTPSDYGVFFGAFGKKAGERGFNAKADLDGDGAVAPNDWSLMLKFCPLGAN